MWNRVGSPSHRTNGRQPPKRTCAFSCDHLIIIFITLTFHTARLIHFRKPNKLKGTIWMRYDCSLCCNHYIIACKLLVYEVFLPIKRRTLNSPTIFQLPIRVSKMYLVLFLKALEVCIIFPRLRISSNQISVYKKIKLLIEALSKSNWFIYKIPNIFRLTSHISLGHLW